MCIVLQTYKLKDSNIKEVRTLKTVIGLFISPIKRPDLIVVFSVRTTAAVSFSKYKRVPSKRARSRRVIAPSGVLET